jgi:hypothetical protein
MRLDFLCLIKIAVAMRPKGRLQHPLLVVTYLINSLLEEDSCL